MLKTLLKIMLKMLFDDVEIKKKWDQTPIVTRTDMILTLVADHFVEIISFYTY